jgi:hypothetical protein
MTSRCVPITMIIKECMLHHNVYVSGFSAMSNTMSAQYREQVAQAWHCSLTYCNRASEIEDIGTAQT